MKPSSSFYNRKQRRVEELAAGFKGNDVNGAESAGFRQDSRIQRARTQVKVSSTEILSIRINAVFIEYRAMSYLAIRTVANLSLQQLPTLAWRPEIFKITSMVQPF
ncbi:hypothetical protein IEQ34_007401 [Dendrobium chrysotoxum]|uniref:Uncharacterized protein n=1 Tax=Dendrobium chrysotoxum TaxID=161865 RepID=A0AAV7HAS4_DENCH|nr:hypothetical protein IEQ34_007401 [Dendrobium chrysotoxum]